MHRRALLETTLAAVLATALSAEEKRPRRILLRSSWQTVNIGDIAHTPGVLALLEQYLPDAEVRLWPSSVADGVEAMLRRRFPKLVIALSAEEKRAALAECDFLLHGSGPSLVGQKEVARWHDETGKPFGVYGITQGKPDAATAALLSAARFVFFRDSVSLKTAQEAGVKAPIMAFGPDGAFACDLTNDQNALAFMAANGLEAGRFLCCIPRLRYTPYWLIRRTTMTADMEKRHERNEQLKEHDHAPLREAICQIVRGTDLKVLLCPEDQSQMAVGREMLLNKLPDDVRAKVVWREKYWLTDEAVSTYTRSAGLFGLEMHSPILCIGHGIPAIVCRFAEQTSKGFMWRDIGLDDWLFDMDNEDEVARVVPAVLALAKDPAAARAKAEAARERVREHQRRTMGVLAESLRLP